MAWGAFSDSALVLRIGRFRETDLWLRLLTRHKGLITAFAFGGSKSRRRFTGCLDLFNRILVSAEFSKQGGFINLKETTLLASPPVIRGDRQRLGMAANCAAFIEALGVLPDDSARIFALAEAVFSFLNSAEGTVPAELPILFRFRLAAESGYAVNLERCSQCGAQQNGMFFSVADGACVCPRCRHDGMNALFCSKECLDMLKKVQENSPDEWFSPKPGREALREACRLIDAFVRYHLGLEWNNGRFRRN